MAAYYNENDPFAVAWLRHLIAANAIAAGEVDDRSIEDVKADDLRGFAQHHFFAGIGVWSRALRQAGWPDDRPVWTGSCPCQPFSAAGKRGGFADKRHLWPVWFRLIAEHRPDTVFGEQVASKDGLAWFDTVSTDLEGSGYAVGAVDTCAASVGAPHIRQRLYFVGHSDRARSQPRHIAGETLGHGSSAHAASGASGVAYASIRSDRGQEYGSENIWPDSARPASGISGRGETGDVANTTEPRCPRGEDAGCDRGDAGEGPRRIELERDSPTGRMADLPATRLEIGMGRETTGPEEIERLERLRSIGSLADTGCEQNVEQRTGRSPEPRSDGQDNRLSSGSREKLCGAATRNLADATGCGRQRQSPEPGSGDPMDGTSEQRQQSGDQYSGISWLAHTFVGRQQVIGRCGIPREPSSDAAPCGETGKLADDKSTGFQRRLSGRPDSERGSELGHAGCRGPTNGYWSDAEWVYCRDEKYRPVEPGTFPLAHGATNRVGRLRGYGNSLVAPQAQAFIEAFLELE